MNVGRRDSLDNSDTCISLPGKTIARREFRCMSDFKETKI